MVLALLTPVIILLEMLHLFLAEKFIGIKQIKAGRHPLETHPVGPRHLAPAWILLIIALWVYMVLLVADPVTRLQGAIMLGTSIAGVVMRRSLGLKWALVILTVEGAVRIGLLVNVFVSVFFFEGRQLPPSWYAR